MSIVLSSNMSKFQFMLSLTRVGAGIGSTGDLLDDEDNDIVDIR